MIDCGCECTRGIQASETVKIDMFSARTLQPEADQFGSGERWHVGQEDEREVRWHGGQRQEARNGNQGGQQRPWQGNEEAAPRHHRPVEPQQPESPGTPPHWEAIAEPQRWETAQRAEVEPQAGQQQGRAEALSVRSANPQPSPWRQADRQRSQLLFTCDLGDPVSCVYVSDSGCMGGTVMGKVWLSDADGENSDVLTAWSDEGIRGLYVDEAQIYVTICEGYRSWQRGPPGSPDPAAPTAVCFRSLDRKNVHSVKYVLQRGPWACVLFPVSSTVVHVGRREHHHRAFKLCDVGAAGEVAPCDFDGESLVLVDRTNQGAPPVFRLVQLERDEHLEFDDLPRGSSISLVRLWGPDCLAYVVGSVLYLWDYRRRCARLELRGHRAEIVAVDAQDERVIATLSGDAVVKLWDGETGQCLRTLRVPEAGFFMGYPYCLHMQGQRILLSADQGVYLVDMGAPLDDV